MEIMITTGTYNTSDYCVVAIYGTIRGAQRFISKALEYKGEIYNGLTFSFFGKTYKVSFN